MSYWLLLLLYQSTYYWNIALFQTKIMVQRGTDTKVLSPLCNDYFALYSMKAFCIPDPIEGKNKGCIISIHGDG